MHILFVLFRAANGSDHPPEDLHPGTGYAAGLVLASGLLRGLVRDVEPVVKKSKVIKDEMRKRCGELDARVQRLEEALSGKE